MNRLRKGSTIHISSYGYVHPHLLPLICCKTRAWFIRSPTQTDFYKVKQESDLFFLWKPNLKSTYINILSTSPDSLALGSYNIILPKRFIKSLLWTRPWRDIHRHKDCRYLQRCTEWWWKWFLHTAPTTACTETTGSTMDSSALSPDKNFCGSRRHRPEQWFPVLLTGNGRWAMMVVLALQHPGTKGADVKAEIDTTRGLPARFWP